MLAQLPIEVLLEVMEAVHNAERLLSGPSPVTFRSISVHELSLVSKYLRAAALRIILAELSWMIGIGLTGEGYQTTPRSRQNALMCCRLLTDRPELRGLVHKVRVFGEPTRRSDSVLDLPVFHAIEEVIPLLPNLQTLQLQYLPITFPLHNAFRSLPSLDVLDLRDCGFKEGAIAKMAADSRPIAVRRLVAELSPQPDVDQEHLRQIWTTLVFSPSITSLSLNPFVTVGVTEEIPSRVELQALKMVGLNIRWVREEEQAAMEFLGRCPEIEELKVELMRADRTVPVSVPVGVLTKLGIYRGSFGCAEEFITGRPVHTIDLNSALRPREETGTFGRFDNIEQLQSLAIGTVPVKWLRFGVVSWNASLLTEVARLFPKLETLIVDDRGGLFFEVRIPG